MKRIFHNYFIVFFVVLVYQQTQAQDPNWSVNSSSFQYSMTFTTFLNVDGTTLKSSNDKIAAFVNGEVRGVSNVVFVSSANKYVSYLTVFSNKDKETINFKIYNSTTNKVVDISKTEVFTIDGNLGGVFQSYSLASPTLSDKAIINSFAFLGITAIETTISSDKIKIVLPKDTNVNTLKSVFSSSENANVYVGNVIQDSGITIQNFTNSITYRVLSENEAVLNDFEVSVTIAKNANPTTVNISNISDLDTNTVPIPVKITFSNAVSGFDVSDVVVENAIISSFTKIDSANYNVEIVPLSQGDLSIQVAENATLDADNNQNKISNKVVFSYDVLKPLISNTAVVSDANSWWYLVTFSEDVLNVDKTDFTLKGLASKDLEILAIETIAANQYKVNIGNTSAVIGTISLQLNSASDIEDKNSNKIVVSDFDGYYLNNKVLSVVNNTSTTILISPNPFVNHIKVSLKEGILKEMILYNLNGKTILSKKINQNKSTLNLERIKSGIYFLKIISDTGIETKKIIKI